MSAPVDEQPSREALQEEIDRLRAELASLRRGPVMASTPRGDMAMAFSLGQRHGTSASGASHAALHDAEQQLRARDHLLRRIADVSPAVIYVHDLEQDRAVFISGNVLRALGYTPEQIDAMGPGTSATLMHPDDRARLPEHFQRLRQLADGETVSLEYRMRHRDGSWRWFHASDGVFERHGDGGVRSVIGCAIDISDRKQIEQQLRQTTERFEVALRSSPIVVFNQDRELRYTWIYNPALDMQADEVLGRTDHDLFERPEDADRTTRLKRQVMASGVGARAEVPVHSLGHKRVYDLTVEPHRDDSGVIVGVTCVAVDVTANRATDLALRESQERLRLALEAAYLIAFTWDIVEDRVVRDLSHEPLLPENRDQPSRLADVRGLVHPEDRDLFDRKIHAALTDPAGHYACEYRLMTPDGQVRWLSEYGVVTFDETGRPVRLTGVSQDVTGSRRAAQVLRDSEQRLQLGTAVAGLGIVDIDYVQEQARLDLRACELFDFPLPDDRSGPSRVISLAELRGRLHPEDRPELLRALEAASRRDASGLLAMERRVVLPSGEIRWQAIRAQLLFASSDTRAVRQAVRAIVAVYDITERMRVERERQRLAATLDAFVSATPVGLALVDRDFRYHFVNQSLADLNGLPVADHTGKLVADVLPQIWADMEPIFRRVLDSGEPVLGVEITGQSLLADRGIRTCVASFFPVRLTSSEVSGVGIAVLDITERVRSERERKESEERYRLVARATNDVIWDWNLQTDRLDWNEAVLEHFGCPRESLEPHIRSWHDRIHPDDRERVIGGIHHAIDTGLSGWTAEYRFRKDDGTYAVFLDRGHIARDEQGRAYRMIGSMLDLTERRRAEQALRESEEKFRTLADHIAQLAWMTDASGAITWYNRRWFDYTGTTLEQMRGWGWQSVHHPDHVDRVTEKFRQHIASAEPWEDSFPLRGRDGRYRWFLSRAIPIRDESGQVVRWFGTNTDVTEQRLAEQELQERERELRSITSNTPDILARFDREGRYVYVNAAATVASGLPAEQLVGRTPREAGVSEEAAALIGREVQAVFADGRPRSFEFTYQTPAGPRHFRSTVVPEFDADGRRVSHVLGVTHDVTEVREALEALRQTKDEAETANRAKDKFLAVLSHELRTPLTPVLMTASMLRRRDDVAGEVREAMDLICRNVELESRLIDDLLDLSRVLNGKLQLHARPVPLHTIIRHAVETCAEEAHAKQLTLVVQLDEPSPIVDGDAARLQQVFWNLLKNAIKFTSEKGRIDVTSTVVGPGHVRVSVCDNGIGIRPEALPRIFNAFEQGDSEITRRYGGLGLGLGISRGIVEMHQGSLEAHSDGEDHGSAFHVTLPATPAPPAAEDQHAPRPEPHDPRRPLRLLLVEDHADTARVLAKLLSLGGHEVTVAHSVADALAAAAGQPFDLVISDIGLPDGTGYELMRRLRDRHQLRGIAMTGYGMEDDLRQSRDAGFLDHLVKPVDPNTLQRTIRRLTRG
jgi:PAS domain S-box-containing protein